MSDKTKKLDVRFKKAITKLAELQKTERYEAVFIFGSVAEGTSNAQSDLDAMVIVKNENDCENINHPTFDDYKLDLTFRSFQQIETLMNDQIKQSQREPNLVRGVILFDKTGELTQLQKSIEHVKPPRYTAKDYQLAQFQLYHANNKVERFLKDDPVSSLYSMHANIGEVLKVHFMLHGHWWVSSKNVLKKLDEWDKELVGLVRQFLQASAVYEKYAHWTDIIDYIAKPMGGRQPIAENNCECEMCAHDLETLYG